MLVAYARRRGDWRIECGKSRFAVPARSCQNIEQAVGISVQSQAGRPPVKINGHLEFFAWESLQMPVLSGRGKVENMDRIPNLQTTKLPKINQLFVKKERKMTGNC
jgi:hypothetical protein